MASTSRNGLNTSVLHPVWRKLPMELVEVVLKSVPFKSLVCFRAVCKRFKCLITSTKFARECQRQEGRKFVPVIVRSSIRLNSCSMEVFNFKTNSWMTLPLPILDASFYPLDLVATSEGLVCFVTQGYERYVVCNPLTGAFRLIEIPNLVVSDICTVVRGQAIFTSLAVDSHTGTFTLVIVTRNKKEAEGRTFLYDSVTGSWRSGAPLPGMVDDFINYNFIKTLTFNGSIYFLLESLISFCKLLKYNVCRDNWSEISISNLVDVDDDVDILEHQGQVVLVNLTCQWLPYIHWDGIDPPNPAPNIGHVLFDYPITLCKVIQAVVGHGQILVEDRVMVEELCGNVDSYQGWIDVIGSEGHLTTIGSGDVICITRDKPCYPMEVLHVNCSTKKTSLLPVCHMVNSCHWAQEKFVLSLLQPSLITDL